MLTQFHSKIKTHLICRYGKKECNILNLSLGSNEDPELWFQANIKKVIAIDGNRARVAVCKNKLRLKLDQAKETSLSEYKTKLDKELTNKNDDRETNQRWVSGFEENIHERKTDQKLVNHQTISKGKEFDDRKDFNTFESKLEYIHQNSKELLFDSVFRKYTKSFDLVTLFFDLEHFFQKESYFKNLMSNASQALKTGGHFIMTGFSGERINKVMTRAKLIKGKHQGNVQWIIESNYKGDFDLNKPNFDKSIKISHYGSYGFKEKILVNMNYIILFAPLYGFKLVELTTFKCFYHAIKHNFNLNAAERELSFYNDCLVLKKI